MQVFLSPTWRRVNNPRSFTTERQIMETASRMFVGFALLIVLSIAMQTAAAPQGIVEFFVSAQGQDRWSGRLASPDGNDGPFATVARARDAVRDLLKSRKEARPVRVVLCGGTYYLDQPLEFGPEDSGTEQAPVVYAAAVGERVVLSGGRRLENGRWGEVNARKTWVVDIPEVKTGTWRFRQLFVNGERRARTRLPRQGEYRIESLPGYTGDFLRSPTRQFVYAQGNIEPTWRNLQDVEIVGITRWLDNRLPIESVDGATRTVTFDRASLFALVSSATSGDGTPRPSVYWVENVFEALDTPGQWYLDRPKGKLCCLPRPGEDMASVEIIAPRLTQVVRVIGRAGAPAHDIRFEGLVFAHTEWQPPADYTSSLQAGIEVPGALLFDYAERCAVTDGRIEHVGNYAVEVGVGCADIDVTRNRITDIGAGGIRIGHFFSWETDGFELTCQCNIVCYGKGQAIGSYGGKRWSRDICLFDRNLHWNVSGKPVLLANTSFAEWQKAGQDKDGLVADPLFVDPARSDFRLRPGSPAAKIGFEPWDMSAAGPRPFSVTAK